MENRSSESEPRKTLEQLTTENESYVGLDKARVEQILEELYGEPRSEDGFRFYIGDTKTADSIPFNEMPIESKNILTLKDPPDEMDSIIHANIKNRVVIELGSGPRWVRNATYAKELGASAYVCIDIDGKAMREPNWSAIESFNALLSLYKKDRRVEREDLVDFVSVVVDDPIHFLSRLEDHSAVTISSALFTEPLDRNAGYRYRLTKVVTDKTFFGAHIGGPSFNEEDFAVSEKNQLEDIRSHRLRAAIYRKPRQNN